MPRTTNNMTLVSKLNKTRLQMTNIIIKNDIKVRPSRTTDNMRLTKLQ